MLLLEAPGEDNDLMSFFSVYPWSVWKFYTFLHNFLVEGLSTSHDWHYGMDNFFVGVVLLIYKMLSNTLATIY